jgi:hypothetical protein
MRWRRYALVTLILVVLPFHFQDIVYAQERPPWFLRPEVGKAKIHDSPDDGAWGALRIGRHLESRGYARLDVGLSYSSADEGFVALEIGLEVRPSPGEIATPVLGGGVGFLTEPEFGGGVLRVVGGLDVKIGRKVGLRLGLQLGRHGGVTGPHVIFAGLEFALGSSAP